MKQIKEQIHALIDKSLSETDTVEQYKCIEQCYNLCLQNALPSYSAHRELIQFFIGELQRSPDVSRVFLLNQARGLFYAIEPLLNKEPPESLTYIGVEWNFDEVKPLLDKIVSLYSGEHVLFVYNPEIGNTLSLEERRKVASSIIDCIQHHGLSTSWNKATIDTQTMFADILYSICKHDNILDLFYFQVQTVADRLNTSDFHQEARDWTEGVIQAGFIDNNLDFAHLLASRAYTAAHNFIAGLLFVNIAMTYIAKQGKAVLKQESFELVWQILKVFREGGAYDKELLGSLSSTLNRLDVDEYKLLAFHHSMFAFRLLHGDDVISEVYDFLNAHREGFFKNLEHGAMPWLSLFEAIHKKLPHKDSSCLSYYEGIVNQAVPKGNESLSDIVRGENLAKRMKEMLVKLKSTRNLSDYTHDNWQATLTAKQLITQSATCNSISDYILAMHVRADYTFVFQCVDAAPYAHFEVEDVNGEEFSLMYQEEGALKELMDTAPSDLTMWIGCGTERYYAMLQIRDMFSFEPLDAFSSIASKKDLFAMITSQAYTKEVKKAGEPIYIKSAPELQEETDFLFSELSKYPINVPGIAQRLLVVKDMGIASYPHNLLVDCNQEKFVGELMPIANIISTEVLIKTNFNDLLTKNFSKSYWSPIDSGEFTFENIMGGLEDVLTSNGFNIDNRTCPDIPISSDLNIFCAHGGKNISETEWFYADDKSLTETNKIIGRGKILILFVCHSGSINKPLWENAMHTIIKRYIRMGYSSVIAPMWSLPTTILPTWLSFFMSSMTSGEFVIDAVYKANMAVKEEFIASSAWACLHLFGNPYLRIKP